MSRVRQASNAIRPNNKRTALCNSAYSWFAIHRSVPANWHHDALNACTMIESPALGSLWGQHPARGAIECAGLGHTGDLVIEERVQDEGKDDPDDETDQRGDDNIH